MSLSVPGAGNASPIFAQSGSGAAYAHNADTSNSTAATTLGAEKGAAAVVYEPGPAQEQEALTYSNRNKERRAAEARARAAATQSGKADDLDVYLATQAKLAAQPRKEEAKVIEATGGTILPPPSLPDTALSAATKAKSSIWAPVKPIMTEMPEGWSQSTKRPNPLTGHL